MPTFLKGPVLTPAAAIGVQSYVGAKLTIHASPTGDRERPTPPAPKISHLSPKSGTYSAVIPASQIGPGRKPDFSWRREKSAVTPTGPKSAPSVAKKG
jgi:hypothetical protein